MPRKPSLKASEGGSYDLRSNPVVFESGHIDEPNHSTDRTRGHYAASFSGLAVAQLGETPDQVKERLGKPMEILGSDGVPVPAPADIAYLYCFPGYMLCFYFKGGACGEIRVIRFKSSSAFTMEEVKADFEKATGVASEGCDQTDEDDLKSIVSRDRQCLARTNDPLTLFIEDFSFFAYEATAASRSGK